MLSDFFSFSLQTDRYNGKKKKPKQTNPKPITCRSGFLCLILIFLAYSKCFIYLLKEPMEHLLGSGCFFDALYKFPADLGFFFLYECVFLVQRHWHSLFHIVYVLSFFWFCWHSDMFSVKGGLEAHYPAWQEQQATTISWGETSRCNVWDFSSPNYINYIISLKQHSKWNHSLKVLHIVQLPGLL